MSDKSTDAEALRKIAEESKTDTDLKILKGMESEALQLIRAYRDPNLESKDAKARATAEKAVEDAQKQLYKQIDKRVTEINKMPADKRKDDPLFVTVIGLRALQGKTNDSEDKNREAQRKLVETPISDKEAELLKKTMDQGLIKNLAKPAPAKEKGKDRDNSQEILVYKDMEPGENPTQPLTMSNISQGGIKRL